MRSLIIFGILFCVCQANPTTQIRCGYSPEKLYSCLGSPKIVKPEIASQCPNSDTECVRMTCIYDKAGWLNGAAIDKTKLSKHMDNFGKEHPEWLPAIQQAKTSCLVGELPAQGVHINCPAYDVTECILTNFVRYAQPNQWSASKECQYPRQFAGACPLCPADCFSPVIPVGTCNACLSLPRAQ